MGHRVSQRRSASKVLVTLTEICHTLASGQSWHAHAVVLEHMSSLCTYKTLTYVYAEGDEQIKRQWEEKTETKGRKRPW